MPFFRVVYDCGSSRARTVVEREVAAFTTRHGMSHDLLFISHFDKDHVSGLPVLLGAGVRFRRVIAPLLSVEERLLSYSKSISAPRSSDPEDLANEAFYQRLVVSPDAALSEVAETVDLVPPGQGDGDSELVPLDLVIDPDVALEIDLKQVLRPAVRTVELSASLPGTSGSGTPLWEFKYFVLQRVRTQAPHFLDQLRGALGISVDELADCLADETCLWVLVTEYQDQLRTAYDALKGLRTRNDTSLCLYSGPPVTPESFTTHRSRGLHPHTERPEIGSWQIRPGWLGTGDAPLKEAPEVDEFNAVFGPRKENCGYLGLPHHGSKHNHNAAIFDGFVSPPTCVVGADGLHGHPHHEVVLCAANKGSVLIIATAEESARSVESCVIQFR